MLETGAVTFSRLITSDAILGSSGQLGHFEEHTTYGYKDLAGGLVDSPTEGPNPRASEAAIAI